MIFQRPDGVVDPAYSVKLRDELRSHRVTHEYHPNRDDYHERTLHPFRPGGNADVHARAKTVEWLKKYVTPAT